MHSFYLRHLSSDIHFTPICVLLFPVQRSETAWARAPECLATILEHLHDLHCLVWELRLPILLGGWQEQCSTTHRAV